MVWNSLMSIGRKAYNGAKGVIGSALGGASNVAAKVGEISSWVDNILNVASSYPIVGDIAQNVMDSEIYKDIKHIIHGANQILPDVEQKYSEFINQLDEIPAPSLFEIRA